MASKAYPTRVNFPKSPVKRMNDFNYYTSFFKKINDLFIRAGEFYFIDNFKCRDICHNTRYLIDGNYFLFIRVPDDVETVYLKDYKLVIISNQNILTGEYEPVNITFPYGGEPRKFKDGKTSRQGKRGFLWRIDNFPTYNGYLFGAVARKKGTKWEYSGVFNLRGAARIDWDAFEAPVPPLTVIS